MKKHFFKHQQYMECKVLGQGLVVWYVYIIYGMLDFRLLKFRLMMWKFLIYVHRMFGTEDEFI